MFHLVATIPYPTLLISEVEEKLLRFAVDLERELVLERRQSAEVNTRTEALELSCELSC